MISPGQMLHMTLWEDVVEKHRQPMPRSSPAAVPAVPAMADLKMTKILMLAFLHWLKPVTEIYRLAGLANDAGNRLKEELIKKGLVYEEKLQLESGRGKVINSLFLTDKGLNAIHVNRDVLKGKGHDLHKRLQCKLQQEIKTMGLKSTIELRMNGKSADLGVWLGDNLWAVEIVVTTARLEHQNLLKDIEAGFHRIAFIVKDCNARQRVERTITEHCQEQIKNKYYVCYLYEFLELIKEQMRK